MLGLYRKNLMKEVSRYLKDNLGFDLGTESYSGASSWPLFLERAADYYLCSVDGVRFVIASIPDNATLPELKRVFNQAAKRAGMPIVLANDSIDARQRKALVQQGIPFVVPDKQAYLPFLGFIAAAKTEKRSFGEYLSPSSQAALVAIVANPDVKSASALKEITNLATSSVSRALDELAERELITKSKDGRNIIFAYNEEKNALLKQAMPYLTTPIVRKIFARKSAVLETLPDAGDSALASRSMLAYPAVAQKAVTKNKLKSLVFDEILEGELDNVEMIELQIWSYDPLVAGLDVIDSVSLALSLVEEQDERIFGELNSLFNEEDLWQ